MEWEAGRKREEFNDEGDHVWAENQKRKKKKVPYYLPVGHHKSDPAYRSDEDHDEYERTQPTPLNILANCATRELKLAARERQMRIRESLAEGRNSETPSGDSDGDEYFDREDPGTVINGQRLFKCLNPVCKKTFPSRSRMRRHYIIHTGAKPFKCLNSRCNKTFSRRDNMVQHYRGHCTHTDKTERDDLMDKENREW